MATSSNPSQIAYSMNETMVAMRVSRAVLYDLINDGMLRTYKIGRRRFCTHDALTECQHKLEEQTA